jgi:ferredoxin-NADP reductase
METRGVSSATTQTYSPSKWLVATVLAKQRETPMATTFQLQLPHSLDHLPGQHYEIRLTAEDGYQAARLYSAAYPSDGKSNILYLTVEYMLGGEVTPYLCEQLQVGDELEVRGPLGHVFVWDPDSTEPVLLVGGGSGIVPLHCMWRAHALNGSSTPLQLVYSTRYYDGIVYREEFLADTERVAITLTRAQPPNWQGGSGRLSRELLERRLTMLPGTPMCYVCGMNAFVTVAISFLLKLGIPPSHIRAERFGT